MNLIRTCLQLLCRLSEKVGTFIQNNILEEGHDSSADARAALDLVKWRVKLDVAAGLAQ
jgi:hypothetical protein